MRGVSTSYPSKGKVRRQRHPPAARGVTSATGLTEPSGAHRARPHFRWCDPLDGAQLQRLLLAPKRDRTEGHRRNAGRKPWQPIDEVSRGEHISV